MGWEGKGKKAKGTGIGLGGFNKVLDLTLRVEVQHYIYGKANKFVVSLSL